MTLDKAKSTAASTRNHAALFIEFIDKIYRFIDKKKIIFPRKCAADSWDKSYPNNMIDNMSMWVTAASQPATNPLYTRPHAYMSISMSVSMHVVDVATVYL